MKELKERMLVEINNYIKRTKDYDLESFISNEILDYERENDVELIWWPKEYNEDQVIDISIENA